MHITINADGQTTVREEHRGGDRYLVAEDVGLVRPQVLVNGYVPEASVAASTDAENTHGGTGWAGTTATLNHPRDDSGEVVLAANDAVQEEYGLGELEGDYWDGEYVRADVAVNADRAEAMGGEAADVVAALENGDPLDVSSQYLGVDLPPGEYDGEHRESAEAIVAPDALALLPNKPGQCSVEHGCGVNPDAASGLGLAANAGHLTATGATDDPDTTDSSAETGEDAAPGRPMTDSRTYETIGRVVSGLTGGMVGHETAADPTGNDGDGDDGGASGADAPDDDPEGTDAGTTGADTPADGGSGNQTMDADTRTTLIEEITANSAIKEESLEGMGDQCLETTHESVVGNSGDDPDDDPQDDPGADDPASGADDVGGDDRTIGDMSVEELGDALADQGFVTQDGLDAHVEKVANQRSKEERVERIVANSAEYDSDDTQTLLETPDDVLDRIERGIDDGGAAVPASHGPGTQVVGNTDGEIEADPDDLGTGVIR